MINLKTNPKRGFTIIETLVAVAILMIAIAGPLVAASKGLSAAQYAKDQLVATALAQEGMELVRNVKDIAIYTDPTSPDNGFTTIFNSSNLGSCKSGPINKQCGIWLPDGYSVVSYQKCLFINNCNLYLNNNQNAQVQYLDTVNGDGLPTNKTIFTRTFYASNTGLPAGEEQVTVTVSWSEKGVPSAVSLTSELTASII